MIAVILIFMRGMKLVQKTNLKELKAIMEVLLVTVRCSIQVYIGYLVLPYKPNISLIHSILYNKLFAYICKFLYLYNIILADIYA